jgi:hypothetical protein
MPSCRVLLSLQILLLLLILAPLAACGTFDVHLEVPGQAREVDTVTVEVVVTAGSTIVAEQGVKATITVLATENVQLAAQLTRQATPTTPTTPDATSTCTPEPTTTSTDTPKPTPTPTKTSQPTPRPTSTSNRPLQILSFVGSPDPVERGGTVTLTWSAPRATSVGITRLSPEGDIFEETEALDLPVSGSIALQVPGEYTERVKYYLGARDANGVLHKAYVTIGIICRYDEYMAPRCPLTQDSIWAAYEPFERGHMVWRSDTREIYVLYADGSYETYADTWHEGDPVAIPGSPPPGLHAPVRGFGNLYARQPRIRERLGWATAPEAGYTMEVETIRGGSGRYPAISTYFTLPDNQVVNLYPFTSTWEIIR